jgi:hypothetical protein
MLINDFIWLIDIEEKFKNKRYLIRISTEAEEENGNEDLAKLIRASNVQTMNKFEHLETAVAKMQIQ